MIPSRVNVFLDSDSLDLRKGPHSLLALVRDPGSDPVSWQTLTLESIANQWPKAELDAIMLWDYNA